MLRSTLLLKLLGAGFGLFAMMGSSPAQSVPAITPGATPSTAATPGAVEPGGIQVKPGQQVVFLGDSTTQSGWMSLSGFIHLVSLGLAHENVPIKATQFGAQGTQTKDLLDLYEKNVATMKPKPDWLVISCGLDEVTTRATAPDLGPLEQNMKSLVQAAQGAGQRVMILTTSVANERGDGTDQRLTPYNEALRVLSKSENCLLADVNAAEKAVLRESPGTANVRRLLVSDPALNTHGQRLVASEILKAFGVNTTQLADIEKSWLDAPQSATATANLLFKETVPITMREYNGLESLAVSKHTSAQGLLNTTSLKDVIEALRAPDATNDMVAVQKAAQSLFEKDVAAFLKDAPPNGSAPAGSSNAMATGSTPAEATGALLVKSGQKVAFLGDSITHFGWEHPYGYVHLVVGGLATVGVQVEPIPAGVGGNTSRDMLGRLKGSVLDKKPDWMTLSCGINDVIHGLAGVDLETYKKNITSIVDQAQQAKIEVMILTSTLVYGDASKYDLALVPYNDFLRGLARERKCPLTDLNQAERAVLKSIPATAPPIQLTVDGIHMSPQGDQMIALNILKTFGLTGAQLAQVKAHWLDEPNGAVAEGSGAAQVTLAITLRESDALEKLAATNNQTPAQYIGALYLQTLMEQARSDVAETAWGKLQAGAQALFARKLSALAKNE